MSDLIILKLGSALEELRSRRGDFEHYFAAGLGIPLEACRVVDPRQNDAFPSTHECAAVVITGSPAMITDDHEWSRASEHWVSEVIDKEVPVLGVCYGHQLVARALGARVGWTGNGQEIGTVNTTLTHDADVDALCRDLPRRLTVQACHSQSVHELPSGARLLATNEHDPIQGFAWGDHVWGFQFHPEFDVDIVAAYLQDDRDALRAHGRDPERLLSEVRESKDGQQLLRSFATLVKSAVKPS